LGRQDVAPALVIYSALFATMNAAYGQSMRFVKVEHYRGMLPLAILDGQLKIAVECIDRQPATMSLGVGITKEEVEPHLALSAPFKNLVA
jgi:hypothetical protein